MINLINHGETLETLDTVRVPGCWYTILGIFSTQVARLVRRCGPAALQTISESQSVCQSLSMGLGFGAVIGVDE